MGLCGEKGLGSRVPSYESRQNPRGKPSIDFNMLSSLCLLSVRRRFIYS